MKRQINIETFKALAKNNISLFPYTAAHEQVNALRQVCYDWQVELSFWSFDEILQTLMNRQCRLFYGAASAQSEIWAGCVLFAYHLDQCELYWIYVCPKFRNQGLGKMLMEHVVKWLQQQHVKRIFLEARASNQSAQKFYESLAFKMIGNRPGYYSNGEDALIYEKSI